MKKITAFLTLISLSSCGIDYVGEKRYIFENHVTDTNNQPIAGKSVDIIVKQNNETEIIAHDVTDASGNVLMSFPVPSSGKISVSYVDDNITQPKVIDEITGFDFIDYKLRLAPMKLYHKNELTSLYLQFNQVNDMTQLSGNLTLDGLLADELVHYHPLPEISPWYYNYDGVKVAKNQTIVLQYSVTDYSSTPPLITEHSENIVIGDQAVTYPITY